MISIIFALSDCRRPPRVFQECPPQRHTLYLVVHVELHSACMRGLAWMGPLLDCRGMPGRQHAHQQLPQQTRHHTLRSGVSHLLLSWRGLACPALAHGPVPCKPSRMRTSTGTALPSEAGPATAARVVLCAPARWHSSLPFSCSPPPGLAQQLRRKAAARCSTEPLQQHCFNA